MSERGYAATTVEDLAEAVGMSRSTFFRRFGNKDDVVFADHDHALGQREDFLTHTELPIIEAIVQGTGGVLDLLTRDAAAARRRFDLLHHTPALRDRELIITHRYERVLTDYLRTVLPEQVPAWVASAFSASVASVHNLVLRGWLRGQIPRAAVALDRDLRQLCDSFSPWLVPNDGNNARVLVASYEAGTHPEDVIRAIAAQLHE